jgi:hypothetical protein
VVHSLSAKTSLKVSLKQVWLSSRCEKITAHCRGELETPLPPVSGRTASADLQIVSAPGGLLMKDYTAVCTPKHTLSLQTRREAEMVKWEGALRYQIEAPPPFQGKVVVAI